MNTWAKTGLVLPAAYFHKSFACCNKKAAEDSGFLVM
jgi:hypothetical protein